MEPSFVPLPWGDVVNFDDVADLADGLPEAIEADRHGHRTWFVAGKAFAWERPFSKADLERFGDAIFLGWSACAPSRLLDESARP